MKKVLSFVFAVLLAISIPISTFAQGATSFKFTEEDTQIVKSSFENAYTNKIVVLPTWSLSDAGKSVKVSTTVDLTGFDSNAFVFYNYNKTDNKISLVEKPDYAIDTQSNLTFTTSSNQGFVVISNGTLAEKKAPAPITEVASTVYWVPSGKAYHSTKDCATLKRSTTIKSGTVTQSNKKAPCKVCN